MKTHSILAATLCATASVHAQGTFPPPSGPTVPTQKSLQELWDKMGTLQTQLNTLQAQQNTIQAQLAPSPISLGSSQP